MTRFRDPYETRGSQLSLYPLRTEIDLRQELIDMFDGLYPEISKAQTFLLRKMRRTTTDQLIPCYCVNSLTHEPDKDNFCPYCHGDGFLWDEIEVEGYKRNLVTGQTGSLSEAMIGPGTVNIQLYQFFLRYSDDLTMQDKLVELKLDTEGELVIPYKRKELWKIGNLVDLRADNGRLEFWSIVCFAEKRTFLNGRNG